MLMATDQFMAAVMAVLFLLLPSPVSHKERIRTLGKDSLGETVKEFQVRYPKATCGRATSLEIIPENLVQSGNMDETHCCLNDRASLTEISKFPILNLDECTVHAIFWKGRLCDLTYLLDVRSIQTVLSYFEKLYGPPAQTSRGSEDASKLILVSWMEGDTNLELILSRLGGGDYHKSSTSPNGQPWLEVVSVDLRTTAFYDSRKIRCPGNDSRNNLGRLPSIRLNGIIPP
jgi:hypothetical protein